MATRPKRTAGEISARKRAMERALRLNAERLRREKELTELAADFLLTRELEADTVAALDEQIAALRAQAQAQCTQLQQQGAAVVVSMVARGEGAGRIAQRLGLRVGEVRQLRDEAGAEVGGAAGRGVGGSRKAAVGGAGSGPAEAREGASWGGAGTGGPAYLGGGGAQL